MIDSRMKGAKAETNIKNYLKDKTGYEWQRVPGSGALNPVHGLKGDLYIPHHNNKYCVEVKHYAEDHLTSKVLTSESPQLLEWWRQTVRQANQVDKKPLLIFKFDRSKLFVAFEEMPESTDITYIYIVTDSGLFLYVTLLEDWLNYEKPQFVI